MLTTTPNSENSADEEHKEKLERRRLEGEIFVLQADRSKLLRQEETIATEIRVLKKSIEEKEREQEQKKTERSRILQKVQDIDGEILRIKRSTYKK